DIDQAERGVKCHHMTAALGAKLPLAAGVLAVHGQVPGARRHLDRARLPQAEGIDGSGGPGTAGGAMAIAHCFRLAGHLDLNRTAKTRAFMHVSQSFLRSPQTATYCGQFGACRDIWSNSPPS